MVSEGAPYCADTRALEAMRPGVAMLSAAHRYQDSITVKHQDRTAELAVAIGVRLGLSPSRTDVLQHLQAPFPVAEITLQHHERLDGSGYPRGLSGESILLEARILSVADVFDAMTSNRSYRAGFPADFVLGELQAMAGRLLDADAVDACRHYILTEPIVRPDTFDTVTASQSVG